MNTRRIVAIAAGIALLAAIGGVTGAWPAGLSHVQEGGQEASAMQVLTPTPETRMEVFGDAWVDARSAGFETIRAFVGETECAAAEPIIVPGFDHPTFNLIVPPAAEKPGCGEPGLTVRFMIGDRDAAETVTWQPGLHEFLRLTSGPPFALFHGTYTYPNAVFPWAVVPVIGNTVCGKQLSSLRGEGPTYGYVVVVDPAELTPGCGVPGAVVKFRLVTGEGPARAVVSEALGTGLWQPGAAEEVNLAFLLKPLESLPEAGTQGYAGEARHPSWMAAAALATFGVALIAAGVWWHTKRPSPHNMG